MSQAGKKPIWIVTRKDEIIMKSLGEEEVWENEGDSQ